MPLTLARTLIKTSPSSYAPIPPATSLAAINFGIVRAAVTTADVVLTAEQSKAGLIQITGTMTADRALTITRALGQGSFCIVHRLNTAFALSIAFAGGGGSVVMPAGAKGAIVFIQSIMPILLPLKDT